MRKIAAALVCSAVAVTSSSCLVWRNHWRNSLAVQTAADIPYVDVDDGNDKHKMDIYAPQGAQGAPVVIFVHGGFWRAGDRHVYAPIVGLYGNVGTAMADNDVVTVVPSYRLFPEVQNVDDMLDDIATVVAWTRDHIAVHGGDPNKIVLVGHSAGAHLVSLLAARPDALKKRGVDPSVIKGVVPLSGIYDVAWARDHASDDDREALWQPLFRTEAKELSPQTYFGPQMPPMLFVAGENDYESCLHDYHQVERTMGDEKGRNVFFHFVPKSTHEEIVLQIGTAEDEVGPAVAAFAHFATGG